VFAECVIGATCTFSGVGDLRGYVTFEAVEDALTCGLGCCGGVGVLPPGVRRELSAQPAFGWGES
jgi:hypothetical protein